MILIKHASNEHSEFLSATSSTTAVLCSEVKNNN